LLAVVVDQHITVVLREQVVWVAVVMVQLEVVVHLQQMQYLELALVVVETQMESVQAVPVVQEY
jgi:hypothetical protein